MKILLVDDEQAVRDIFGEILTRDGFELVLGTSGKEAVEKAQKEKPDLILLDQILPDMNGNQAVALLKKDLETKHIPIAILSNYSMDELVKEAINLGVVDYIFKYQIEPQDIIAKVNQIIEESKAKQQDPTLKESL